MQDVHVHRATEPRCSSNRVLKQFVRVAMYM